jgi:hypothetical protein
MNSTTTTATTTTTRFYLVGGWDRAAVDYRRVVCFVMLKGGAAKVCPMRQGRDGRLCGGDEYRMSREEARRQWERLVAEGLRAATDLAA